MEKIHSALDVTGNPIEAGDMVLYSSGFSSALLLGRVIQVRERRVVLQGVHLDENGMTSMESRPFNGLIKLTDPAYVDAPNEWLQALFPTVK